MGKWLAGIASSIIAGVAVAWLSGWMPLGPSPAPQQGAVRGFLVAAPALGVRRPSDVEAGQAICGTPAAISTARTIPGFAPARFRALPAADLRGAWDAGACDLIFVEAHDHADRLFPPGQADVRVVPIRTAR